MVEKMFTTGRYAECNKLASELQLDTGLEAGLKLVLLVYQAACLLALDEKTKAMKVLTSAIDITKQPKNFQMPWNFDGTSTYIDGQPTLERSRACLQALFKGLGSADRDAVSTVCIDRLKPKLPCLSFTSEVNCPRLNPHQDNLTDHTEVTSDGKS